MQELSRDEVDAVLRQAGYGFLGLAQDNRPYVIPMSFGYDGEDLYFQMNARGRKTEYISRETPASFTVVRVDPEAGRSRSVVVDGLLSEVPEEAFEEAHAALAENANFGGDLSLWGVPLAQADVSTFVLRPEELSGRAFGPRDVTAVDE